ANYNEVNIVENGFLEEFKKAQANLVANGGSTFAYTGAPGTQPLPILLAWLSGKDESQAGSTTAYSGSGWTNSTLRGYLYQMNANPQSFASTLRTNGTYKANAENAGLPANFFVVNPDASGAYV